VSDTTLGATRSLPRDGRAAAQLVRMVRLRIRPPDGAPERVQELAQQAVRVGNRRGNDVVLDDETVSRIHFEIALDEHGYRLRDLGSRNGTFVDGVRVRDVYLRPGAVIVAGRCELRLEALDREAELPLSPLDRFGPLLGRSAAMREMFATLERVAPTDFTVLVEGETGTGKELVARALHQASRRSGGPLAVFDAAAAPAELLESQLFGHERGAFTGAIERRVGLVEEADGGTLFIDELGELPLGLQPKLLRAVESREICAVGSNSPRAVDVRVVAATHRDLAAAVNEGTFRDDLYYRLAVVRVIVPPLRERPEDVPLLVEHFVRSRLVARPDRAAAVLASLSAADVEALAAHPWPGNVRQLRNTVDAALALGGDELPVRFEAALAGGRAPRAPEQNAAGRPDLALPFTEQRDAVLAAFEESYLLGVVAQHGGNLSRAAAAAGLDRAYFKRLLRKYR
jgi:DNA-binding NtrC family response regulator